MDSPLVSCCSCQRTWHSATLAASLRDVGACPHCGGELAWADASSTDPPAAPPAARSDVAPHLVLGVPRR